jgi:hypothetical protein
MANSRYPGFKVLRLLKGPLFPKRLSSKPLNFYIDYMLIYPIQTLPFKVEVL